MPPQSSLARETEWKQKQKRRGEIEEITKSAAAIELRRTSTSSNGALWTATVSANEERVRGRAGAADEIEIEEIIDRM